MLGRPITKPVVVDAIRAGIKLKVYAFSGGGWAGRPDFWTDLSLAGNGTNFELTSDALSMYNDLMSIIDEACLPRDEQASLESNELFCFNSNCVTNLSYANYKLDEIAYFEKYLRNYDFNLQYCYDR